MRRFELPSFYRCFLFLFLTGLGSALALASDAYVVVPQLAVGDGWSSDLFVGNQDSVKADNLTLTFYATGTGAPLPVATNLGNGSSFQFSLEGGASKTVRVTAAGALQVGYAILRFPKAVSVRTTLVVRWQSGGATVTQLGVAAQEPADCFSFPVEYDPSKQVSMGVAVVLPVLDTPLTGSHSLVVSLIDQAGAVVRNSIVNLPPGGHLARMLNENELFPGLTSFTGNVVVTARVPVNALALRLEGTVLGSVGVNPGPIVRPFMVSSSPMAEEEANNTVPQGMPLTAPARVSARIGASGDVDCYRFTGKSGDIATVITDTRSMDSDADTVLTLLDLNGTVLATNDQNRLLFCNDSFLQVVLPQDGTYAIRVEEAGNRGGASFGYDLHLRTADSQDLKLTSMTPDTFALGSTVDVTITGRNLESVASLQLSDDEGITVSNQVVTATQVTARFQIWAGATPGHRTVRVLGGGVSNELSFTIIPASTAGKTPAISNLVVGPPSYVENWADIHIAFDFNDPDGDIRYSASSTDHARILFTGGCSDFITTGPILNKAGQVSGRISFTLRIIDFTAGNYTINVQLIDAAGNGSNILTFSTTAWMCYLKPMGQERLNELGLHGFFAPVPNRVPSDGTELRATAGQPPMRPGVPKKIQS